MAAKISETLLEYVAPLLAQLPPGASLQQQQSFLQVVITVWNALVVVQWGEPDLLPDVYRRLEAMPQPGRATMRAMVDALVERKRRHFADDLRAVGRWELRVKPDGEVSLWAEARGPSR
ncbi:hypothetical protein D7X30_41270 [Corallococcus sp. AB011P]|uniref:hypothetical protein n=1 Tax=Corallococcus sp. AB011P TaxID=2316735 RepID=UPI000EA37BA0|nr:hypothetical protein [Corallococcus sp. AB011P]RKG47906.1 hypothetical protein D7X30_41270 [Corallococcus sp. AB011P]